MKDTILRWCCPCKGELSLLFALRCNNQILPENGSVVSPCHWHELPFICGIRNMVKSLTRCGKTPCDMYILCTEAYAPPEQSPIIVLCFANRTCLQAISSHPCSLNVKIQTQRNPLKYIKCWGFFNLLYLISAMNRGRSMEHSAQNDLWNQFLPERWEEPGNAQILGLLR